MKTADITKRITLNLVVGILVTLVTVLLAIWWMAESQNEQARQATRKLIDNALEQQADSLRSVARDYGGWQQAHDAYARDDRDWLN